MLESNSANWTGIGKIDDKDIKPYQYDPKNSQLRPFLTTMWIIWVLSMVFYMLEIRN